MEMFEAGWKSSGLKNILPPEGRDMVEQLEGMAQQNPSHDALMKTFSDWKDMGVWNVSDLVTFAMTSRLTILIADAIEDGNKQLVGDAIEYLLDFVNFLLLTNIHPPSESHGDLKPYHAVGSSFPRTYDQGQQSMRHELANAMGQSLYTSPYKEDFGLFVGSSSSPMDFSNFIEENLLKAGPTPPFLMKNVGLAKELFVFYKLMSEDIGYVIPTLLYQRLFRRLAGFLGGETKKQVLVRTPDFLVVRGGRVMGVELGRERSYFNTQKAALVTGFAGASGLPTTQINVVLTNPNISGAFDLGYKCNLCYRAFILPESYIMGESGRAARFETLPSTDLLCDKVCDAHPGDCEDCAVTADVENYDTGRTNSLLVHLRCLPEADRLGRAAYPLFPTIEGLEVIREGLS
jgi:hypothetical protein